MDDNSRASGDQIVLNSEEDGRSLQELSRTRHTKRSPHRGNDPLELQ